jgi:hypothetical protein
MPREQGMRTIGAVKVVDLGLAPIADWVSCHYVLGFPGNKITRTMLRMGTDGVIQVSDHAVIELPQDITTENDIVKLRWIVAQAAHEKLKLDFDDFLEVLSLDYDALPEDYTD